MILDPITEERLLAEARESYETEADERDRENRAKETEAVEWRGKPCPTS
jgi:hypothetical protein